MWAAGVSSVAFWTSPVSAAQKWFTCKLRDVTPDNFGVSHLFYVFYLSFLCTHPPSMAFDSSICLACICLYLHSPFLLLPFSQLLSLFLSPFAPSVWPLHITRSHRLLFVLPALLSGFPFLPIFLSVSFCLHCLSCCTTEILFPCFPSSLVLSVSGFYYRHIHFTSKHCYSVPLNSSYSMSLLFPRQK